jgi:glucokinase
LARASNGVASARRGRPAPRTGRAGGALKFILAGDIGGTKADLAIYSLSKVARGGALAVVREGTFPSRQYKGLDSLVDEFMALEGERIHAAAFGIAGPVLDDRVKTTNLPWVVSRKGIARLLRTERVRLMNDLESMAYGGLFLPPREIHRLARGKRRQATVGVIAAGTGLGQAFLFWDGERYHPVATEGGHADFAPRNDKELALLVYLQKKFARVSYERVLSGPGLVNIFSFFDEELGRPVSPSVRERLKTEDPGAVIGEAGVAGGCPACVEAVETFLSLYGAQAGNLVLDVMALGGVFVGGGIALKLLPKMTSGLFMSSFLDKGRYRELMSKVPVGVLMNPKTALIGAAHAAAELAR